MIIKKSLNDVEHKKALEEKKKTKNILHIEKNKEKLGKRKKINLKNNIHSRINRKTDVN